MSAAENKDIVVGRWYRDAGITGTSVADELFTDDYRLHLSGLPTAADRTGAKQVVRLTFDNLDLLNLLNLLKQLGAIPTGQAA